MNERWNALTPSKIVIVVVIKLLLLNTLQAICIISKIDLDYKLCAENQLRLKFILKSITHCASALLQLYLHRFILIVNYFEWTRCGFLSIWADQLSVTLWCIIAITCKEPPPALPHSFSNLQNVSSDGSYPYGTSFIYNCIDGRRFEDGQKMTVVTCTGSGNWESRGSSCECT